MWIALAGGAPLVWHLLVKLWHREFGSDLLAAISIITAVLLGEYLAGALVVLMLSGGEALEVYAVQNASSVLKALAGRMPATGRRKRADGEIEPTGIDAIVIEDMLLILPHETCLRATILLDCSGLDALRLSAR